VKVAVQEEDYSYSVDIRDPENSACIEFLFSGC
jgi:hypothetical protein